MAEKDDKSSKKRKRTAYKYDPNYHDAWVFSLAIKGATDEEIAKAFGVSRNSIFRWSWREENGEKVLTSFGESKRLGKEQADAQVIKTLYQKALGYEITEAQQIIEHDTNGTPRIKETRTNKRHIQPDTMAIMYWLNNRFKQTKEWSQRQELQAEITGKDGNPIEMLHLPQIYLPQKED
ncbi:MAG: LuxR family transcriptional regulator [Firmicutes bacterium]|nr:LuxR family transcriptional regulator [Bacillota bacterium]